MKNKADIVRGWLRKAASDVVMMDAGLKAEAYDGACFHAQQAAEKYLKSFLAFHDQPFPYTHNLGDLTELCASIDVQFRTFTPQAAALTPYAVRLAVRRYLLAHTGHGKASSGLGPGHSRHGASAPSQRNRGCRKIMPHTSSRRSARPPGIGPRGKVNALGM